MKRVISKCQVCKRLEGKAFQPPPVADLPNFKVTETKPFTNVGVDFAGPLYVKVKKGEMSKVYLSIHLLCDKGTTFRIG